MSQSEMFTTTNHDGRVKISGCDFNEQRDGERLRGQLKDIYAVMRDGVWRSVPQISGITGHPQASVSAQLRNLRKAPLNYTVEREYVGDGLYRYRVVL